MKLLGRVARPPEWSRTRPAETRPPELIRSAPYYSWGVCLEKYGVSLEQLATFLEFLVVTNAFAAVDLVYGRPTRALGKLQEVVFAEGVRSAYDS